MPTQLLDPAGRVATDGRRVRQHGEQSERDSKLSSSRVARGAEQRGTERVGQEKAGSTGSREFR